MLNLLSKTATTSPLVKENVEDDLLEGRCCKEDWTKFSCRDIRRLPGGGLVVLEGLRLDSRSEVVIGVSDFRDFEGGLTVGVSSLFLLLLFFFFEILRATSVWWFDDLAPGPRCNGGGEGAVVLERIFSDLEYESHFFFLLGSLWVLFLSREFFLSAGATMDFEGEGLPRPILDV